MKKTVLLSIIASTMIMAGGDVKPVEPVVVAPVVEEESFGTVSGQLRAFYIDRTYSGMIENNRNALAFGGWLGYDTADWNGLTAGVKFYATEGASIHDGPKTSASYDPSLYGDNFTDYGFIGEAYLNYKFGNTNIKAGRQKLNTPLAGADDARMLPNLFEAAVLSNSDIEGTTLILAQVNRMTVGTFANVYTPGALSIQGGYGLGFKTGTNGNFSNMGVIALGTGNETDGVTTAAIIYKGVEGLNLQAWNYYGHDILNALYLSADYGWKVSDSVKLKASAQYIGESDVGDALAGKVDSNFWAVKLGASSGALSGYLAYSQTGDSDGSMNGGIITPWGGIPAYTQGMVTRHMFFSGTDTWKAAGVYKFNKGFDVDLKAVAYYASFDVGETSTYAAGVKSSEAGFDIIYKPASVKGLNLRFRGNFPSDFTQNAEGQGLDWAEYRLIANYNF